MSPAKKPALLICVSKRAMAIVFAALVCAATSLHAGSCRETAEIISNNMAALAGNGDTLWVASLSAQQDWGVNFTTSGGTFWWGNYLGCLDGDLRDVSFGSGIFTALFSPASPETNTTKPSIIWYFLHKDNTYGSKKIAWPESLTLDTLYSFEGVDGTSIATAFYYAFQNGGVLRWNPADTASPISGFIPGSKLAFVPSGLSPQNYPGFGADSLKVFAVDRFGSGTAAQLLAVTAPKLWLFKAQDTSWDDSTITTTLSDTTWKFTSFVSAFVNNSTASPVLYAYIGYFAGSKADTAVFRYHSSSRSWSLIIKDFPRTIAPAANGYLYVTRGENEIAAYKDLIADSVPTPSGGLALAMTNEDLYLRLTVWRGLSRPGSLNDLLFIKTSDSTGRFAIASTDGLFIAENEQPGVSKDTFNLLRRDRAIKSGLMETYALPGIISDRDPQARFIYKLTKDAKVTIKVFDYNMQLVKNIIENAPRRAAVASGRSTNTQQDSWDGTTHSGRVVAPGVYYYKITASTGERSFGKIVVAKGSSK